MTILESIYYLATAHVIDEQLARHDDISRGTGLLIIDVAFDETQFW